MLSSCLAILFSLVSSPRISAFSLIFPSLIAAQEDSQQCTDDYIWDSEKHKEVYTVGVLAIRGVEASFKEFNKTFNTYLTQTAGQKFDKPIQFEMKGMNFIDLFVDAQEKNVDFIYVNPSAYSCIESEFGANSLASQISHRVVGGENFYLTQFGGVIFTLVNSTVNTIEDIVDRSVAAASISGLGSGQMQFRVLVNRGISYLNDPSQVVFTSNQGKVVKGVMNGDFEVGYVRTDQLERMKDASGAPLDLSIFKIIEPVPNLTSDGKPFPFESSTALYPEWNVAAFTDVPDDVCRAVQEALLDLQGHAEVGEELYDCYNNKNCSGTNSFNDPVLCKESCNSEIDLLEFQCDTSIELGLTAQEARKSGKYLGWRTTLSYMDLRNMQEEVGFINRNPETGTMECIRSANIYDAIVCPEGHFKKSPEEVENGCAMAGMKCAPDFQCLCRPCVKAFNVDVFPKDSPTQVGCAKMALCGSMQQTQQQFYLAVDNKKRDNATLTARIHEGDTTRDVPSFLVDDYTYEFSISANKVGVMIFEVFVNKEQIPESPLQIEVEPRDCATDTNDPLSVPNVDGDCICAANSIEMGGNCVAFSTILPAILVPLAVLSAIATIFYVEHKRKQADSIWAVKVSELEFDDPPKVVGRGTFGLVVLAQYRGTQVAVKRVIPPKLNRKGNFLKRVSFLGSGDQSADGEAADKSSTYSGPVDGTASQELVEAVLANINTQASNGNANENKRPPHFERRASTSVASDILKEEEKQIKRSESRRATLIHVPATEPPPPKEETKPAVTFKMKRRGSLDPVFKANDGTPHQVLAKQDSLRSMEEGRPMPTSVGMKSGSWDPGSMSMSLKSSTSILKSGSVRSSSHSKKRLWRRIFPRDDYSRLKAEFMTEMRHLSKLRHPCITTVMGAVISKKEEPMLVMEYMDHGSLYDLLQNETMVIDGAVVLPILRDIAQGMRFLHTADPQVIHGDLKCQNVLVDGKFHAKVADFGLSQKKKVGATGTPYWMAPELLLGTSENTAESDTYSFGIMLYEVYSRKDPYEGENFKEVLKNVADPEINKRPPVPPGMPQAVADIMKECVSADPLERPNFSGLDQRLKDISIADIEPGQTLFSHNLRKAKMYERSHDMVMKNFPKHVAQAIQEGRKVEAESFECVTIFFSDIVGFTVISSTLNPDKVSDMLDRLYLKFDELSDKHDIFKIETIGDAYMAVTNLLKPQPDHAKRVAEFAIEAIEAANNTLINLDNPAMGYVNIRVGFHSGSVVANVVGSRNLKYSIFGDTVNTASRMESNSIQNRIHCSDVAAKYLRRQAPEIPMKARGKINVKGKGEMYTFWVNEMEEEKIDRRPSDTSVDSNKTERRRMPSGKRPSFKLSSRSSISKANKTDLSSVTEDSGKHLNHTET